MATPKKKRAVKKGKRTPKDISSVMNLMIFPNTKDEKVTNKCFFVINGKRMELSAYREAKIDLNDLEELVSTPVKRLFATLQHTVDIATGQYALRNQYGICLGIVEKRASYKAIIAHHKNNGDNSIIINGGSAFTLQMALDKAKTLKIPLVARKNNWAQINITDDNFSEVLTLSIDLMNAQTIKS
jgi:hypothetical protein